MIINISNMVQEHELITKKELVEVMDIMTMINGLNKNQWELLQRFITARETGAAMHDNKLHDLLSTDQVNWLEKYLGENQDKFDINELTD